MSRYAARDMRSLNVAEAKRRFSELIELVGRGERVLVARRGKPVLALVPPEEAGRSDGPPRGGLLALVGELAEVDDLEAMIDDIYAARRGAQDRYALDLG